MAGNHTQMQSPPHEEEYSMKTPSATSAHLLYSPSSHDTPRLPQTISHRGYKGKFPENTLAAVQGAIQAGTDALEIDLQLSRDGVLVVSHDPSLRRCYGIKKKIADCDWAYLKTLRTLQAPHEPMPRLVDILEYLCQPGLEHIWVLLDIKRSNDPPTIMHRIAQTITSIPTPPSSPPWHTRLILGCWSAQYLPLRAKYLPQYEMSLICLDPRYARQFLHTPNISFNVNQRSLMGPFGAGFLDEARAANRKVFLWTVNTPNLMRWGIRHGVDGIITDDPALYARVCEAWERERDGKGGTVECPELVDDRLSVGQRVRIWVTAVFVVVFGWVLKRRYRYPHPVPYPVERVQIGDRKGA